MWWVACAWCASPAGLGGAVGGSPGAGDLRVSLRRLMTKRILRDAHICEKQKARLMNALARSAAPAVWNGVKFFVVGLPLAVLLTVVHLLQRLLQQHPAPDTCAVCLNHLDIFNEVVSLECCHRFHTECATRWQGYSDSCPICRAGPKLQTPAIRRAAHAHPEGPRGGDARGHQWNQAAAAAARPSTPTTESRLWMWLVMMLVQWPAAAPAPAPKDDWIPERGVGDWRARFAAIQAQQDDSSSDDGACDECDEDARDREVAAAFPPRSKAEAACARSRSSPAQY